MNRRIVAAVALVALAVLTAIMLTACNKSFSPVSQETSQGVISLYDVEVTENGVFAYWTRYEVEEPLAEVKCEDTDISGTAGKFWNVTELHVAFSSAEVYAATRGYISADASLSAAAQDGLKIVFVYDTMDRSIESNGDKIRIGTAYRHTLDVGENDGETVFSARLKYAASASWYSVLIGCAAGALALGAAAAAVVKGRLWQRKKERR